MTVAEMLNLVIDASCEVLKASEMPADQTKEFIPKLEALQKAIDRLREALLTIRKDIQDNHSKVA